MDYEKAYKAVLKTATQWIKDGCTDKEKICLECVFPELRESEDERLRKAALEGIEYLERKLGWDAIGDTDILDVKEYLEKQKDQKPISQEDFDTAKHEALWEEQKPAEWKDYKDKVNIPYCSSEPWWSEEDEEILDGIINTLDRLGYAEFCKSSREEDIEEERFYYKEIQFLNWLKSIRPSWKPNEEQMKALLDAYKGGKEQEPLRELIEQLKKL